MSSDRVRFHNNQRKCRECGCPMKHVGKRQHRNGHHSHVYECRNKGCPKRGDPVMVG